MIADHRRELKSVELRHRNVHKYDRHFVAQQLLERLPARGRLDEILAQLFEDHFVAEKLCRLIVDDQDIHRIAIALDSHSPCLIDVARCEAPKAVAQC